MSEPTPMSAFEYWLARIVPVFFGPAAGCAMPFLGVGYVFVARGADPVPWESLAVLTCAAGFVVGLVVSFFRRGELALELHTSEELNGLPTIAAVPTLISAVLLILSVAWIVAEGNLLLWLIASVAGMTIPLIALCFVIYFAYVVVWVVTLLPAALFAGLLALVLRRPGGGGRAASPDAS